MILARLECAGIPDLDRALIDLFLDGVHVVVYGVRHPEYGETQGQRVVWQAQITA